MKIIFDQSTNSMTLTPETDREEVIFAKIGAQENHKAQLASVNDSDVVPQSQVRIWGHATQAEQPESNQTP